ncbi:hypothetical protein PAHAL_9G425700 [Panicum hallii]|uniref:Uncharacterized protein n=1 Tax=Panicum hallii TaxID=206008 RepID=A0A2T8I4D9_9POAL|nr:hypothetical protein PAHAL_9G425700 [Panicum hallii]
MARTPLAGELAWPTRGNRWEGSSTLPARRHWRGSAPQPDLCDAARVGARGARPGARHHR